MKRKAFLRTAAAAIGGSLLPINPFAKTVVQTADRKPAVRFAHLTDIHVKPGIIPPAGTAKAFRDVNTRDVEFWINGGDAIMDAFDKSKSDTQRQWDTLLKLLKSDNGLPVYHCLGNHDVWGWAAKGDQPAADKQYGKQWALDVLQMPGRHYSFDKNNWHFIVLDSIHRHADGYMAKLDEEQFDWLKQDLKSVPDDRFVCVVSHIPILSMCAGLVRNEPNPAGGISISKGSMHTDFFKLKELFLKHPNVKVCLSGHIHMQDEVEYLDVTYYCNGAVSGRWWGGKFHEFPPAYAVIELYDDGSSARTMVEYGKE